MDKTDNQELFKKIENFKYKKLKHCMRKMLIQPTSNYRLWEILLSTGIRPNTYNNTNISLIILMLFYICRYRLKMTNWKIGRT